MNTYICDCGHPESPHSSITRGYGTDSDGKTYCYDCCAERERQHMIDTGKTTLYLTQDKDGNHKLTDWPGTLQLDTYPRNDLFNVPCYKGQVRKGRHNIARTRYDCWFRGPDNHIWHAVQYGDNTQIAHCKRTKETYR